MKKHWRTVDGKFHVQIENDGSYTAFLAKYPNDQRKPKRATYGWTGARNEEEAIKGIMSLYPNIKIHPKHIPSPWTREIR